MRKMIGLPRQARDKHRENSKKRPAFSYIEVDDESVAMVDDAADLAMALALSKQLEQGSTVAAAAAEAAAGGGGASGGAPTKAWID